MQALFVTIQNVHNIIALAPLCLVRHSGIPFFILLLPAPWVLCLRVYTCACAFLHVHGECVSVCVLRFGLFLCPTFMIILCVCVVCLFVFRLYVRLTLLLLLFGRCWQWQATLMRCARYILAFRSFVRFFLFLFRFFFCFFRCRRHIIFTLVKCFCLLFLSSLLCLLFAFWLRLSECECECVCVCADPASSLTGF